MFVLFHDLKNNIIFAPFSLQCLFTIRIESTRAYYFSPVITRQLQYSLTPATHTKNQLFFIKPGFVAYLFSAVNPFLLKLPYRRCCNAAAMCYQLIIYIPASNCAGAASESFPDFDTFAV
jgi:hypothetical protein